MRAKIVQQEIIRMIMILLDEDQHDACSSNWYIDYIPPCMKHLRDPNIMVEVFQLKISLLFEVHPPQGKRNNNVNHMIKKLRRGNALKVKFSLGEPPD